MRCVEPAEPFLDFLARDRPDGTPLEEGQNLAAKVGSVHFQGSRLPAPAIMEEEDFLGDGLEGGFVRRYRIGIPAVMKCGQHGPSQGAGVGFGHDGCVANGLQTRRLPFWVWMK